MSSISKLSVYKDYIQNGMRGRYFNKLNGTGKKKVIKEAYKKSMSIKSLSNRKLVRKMIRGDLKYVTKKYSKNK